MRYLNTNDKKSVYHLAEQLIGVSQQGKYKKSILISNIEKRMYSTNHDNLDKYLSFCNSDKTEYAHLISALTIHTTSWFREMPHFKMISSFIDKNHQQFKNNTLKVLSAACSSGEEVFSIALHLELLRKKYSFKYSIEGIDIDPICIAQAKRAIYKIADYNTIPEEYRTFLKKGRNRAEGLFTMNKEIRLNCNFQVAGLQEVEKKFQNKFNIIFCRNVLIYFKQDDVEKIIKSLKNKIAEIGQISLGHSEAILNANNYKLKLLEHSTYVTEKTKVELTSKTSTISNSTIKLNSKKEKPTILIVDDSKTVRTIFEKLFTKNNFNVLKAESGEDASQVLIRNKVDLITLDLHMPGENGKDWLIKQRSKGTKTPVVIITDAHESEAAEVIKVLGDGAQDFINKGEIRQNERIIIDTISAILKINNNKNQSVITKKIISSPQKVFNPDMFLIGSSTGGTEALSKLLEKFPVNSPPILIVQHIPPSFALPFAKRLEKISGLALSDPSLSNQLERGHIYIAHDSYHIGVRYSGGKYFIKKEDSPPVNRHRPSVEYLFKSANPFAKKVAAIILTGMGADGSHAMVELKQNGAMTFAQDEKSCVVYGMPKVAIENGGAGIIGDLSKIRSEMEKVIKL